MRDLVKTGVISLAFATVPLNVDAKFSDNRNCLMNEEIKTSLFDNMNRSNSEFAGNRECIDATKVNPKIIEAAVFSYFDEEVKKFELSQEAKNKIVVLLDSYFMSHSVLKQGRDGSLIFEIDDKKAFSGMLKQFVSIVLDDMPFIIRRIVIPIFFGGSDSIYQKLDNLDKTLMNMKEKQYKEIIFDYTAGIIKRVEKYVNGKMKVDDYYNSVNRYYPNKRSYEIGVELDNLGLKNQDIKNLKYPLK